MTKKPKPTTAVSASTRAPTLRPFSLARARQQTRVLLSTLVVVATILVGLVAAAAPASAATNVSVRWGGICSTTYTLQVGGKWGSGVNLNVGARSARNLTLYGRSSWAWKRDGKGLITPKRRYAEYHVRFLDSKGKEVWKQYKSIPNGGSRSYYVGSNVRTIQVLAGVPVDPYGWLYQPMTQPGVAYAS